MKLPRWLKRLGLIFNSSASNPSAWFVDWIRGHESDSGVSLDGKTCLTYAPVWNAVNRICGRVGQLPCVLYEQTGERTKRRATEHPAYRLIKRRPNPLMSAAVFKELMQYHALIWGNGRAWIDRDRRGDPVAIVPLMPDRTVTVLLHQTDQAGNVIASDKWHVTDVEVGPGHIEQRKFRDSNVFHIQGLGYDGLAGYPLWELAKNSWGLGLGAEKQANRLFRNQNVPGLILESPPGTFPDDETARKFLQNFRDMHEGAENAGKTALLREGIKASKLAQSGQEAQAIEQRKFQRQDAALWFLLESMLGDDSSVSYNSLEQKQLAELINCLNPWLVKWQEEAEEKLLREREKAADSHFVRFTTGALLRSDTKTTYETLAGGVRGMLITINEAREVLDLPPIEGGDVLINPAIFTGTPGEEPEKPDTVEVPEENPTLAADLPERVNGTPARKVDNRLREIIAARMRDLAGVERKRVESIMDKDGGDAKLDAFYARWCETLTEALQPLAGINTSAAELAAKWCEDSRETGLATPDLWVARADVMAETIMG